MDALHELIAAVRCWTFSNHIKIVAGHLVCPCRQCAGAALPVEFQRWFNTSNGIPGELPRARFSECHTSIVREEREKGVSCELKRSDSFGHHEDLIVYDVEVAIDRARESAISLLLWLLTVGYDPSPGDRRWISTTLDQYLLWHCAGVYEPHLKYLTVKVQYELLDESIVLGQSPMAPKPPVSLGPERSHFLRGASYLWFLARTGRGAGAAERLRLANAVGFLKKRQPPIPNFRLADSVAEWRRDLFGRERPAPIDELPPTAENVELRRNFRLFKRAADLVILVLFGEERSTDLETPKAPSSKARLANDRRFPADGKTTSEIEYMVSVADLAELSVLERVRNVGSVPYHEVPSVILTGPGGLIQVTHPIPGLLPRVLESCLDKYSEEPIPVKEVALAEPFKVRMISKPPPDVGVLASAIQRILGRALLRLPGMGLTREDPELRTAGHVQQVFGEKPLEDGEFYVSGDYSRSTDALDPRVSEYIVEEISRRMGLDERVTKFFRRLLTGHCIVEEGPSGRVIREQSWGQLMGSPVSFPVLCIANYAMTIAAMDPGRVMSMSSLLYKQERENLYMQGRMAEHDTTMWQFLFGNKSVGGHLDSFTGTIRLQAERFLKSRRCLVNGDDVAFIATSETYRRWREITSSLGLSPSPGKNFISRQFVQLNSVMMVPRPGQKQAVDASLYALADEYDRYHNKFEGWSPSVRSFFLRYHGQHTIADPTRVEYTVVAPCHIAVLAPPRRVANNELYSQVDAWQQKYLDYADMQDKTRLNSLYIRRWSEQLKKTAPSDVTNWFFPRWAGGLGLWTDRPIESNLGQRRAAGFFRSSIDQCGKYQHHTRMMRERLTSDAYTHVSQVSDELERLGGLEWVDRRLEPDRREFVFPGLVFLLSASGVVGRYREREIRGSLAAGTLTGAQKGSDSQDAAATEQAEVLRWDGGKPRVEVVKQVYANKTLLAQNRKILRDAAIRGQEMELETIMSIPPSDPILCSTRQVNQLDPSMFIDVESLGSGVTYDVKSLKFSFSPPIDGGRFMKQMYGKESIEQEVQNSRLARLGITITRTMDK